jgi:hypothetical protein
MQSYRDSFKYIEVILLKLATAPVVAYDQIALDLFSTIISATDNAYHRKIVELLIESIDAILLEKKMKRAENFKSKIYVRCANMITLVCQLSDPSTVLHVY